VIILKCVETLKRDQLFHFRYLATHHVPLTKWLTNNANMEVVEATEAPKPVDLRPVLEGDEESVSSPISMYPLPPFTGIAFAMR